MDNDQLQKFLKGNYQQIIGQYDSAIATYKELQQEGFENNYQLSICLIQSLIALNNYESALKECEKAILQDRKQYEAIFRRGICKFYMKEFQSALIDFNDVQDKIEKNPVFQRQIQCWIGRCQAELNNQNLKDLQETGYKAPQQQQQKKEEVNQQQKQDISQKAVDKNIKYQWYQTDKTVGIEIHYQLENQKDLKVEFTNQSLKVNFPIKGADQYGLDIVFLEEVKPETAKYQVHLEKIEITVEKKEKQNWKQLQKSEEDQKAQTGKPRSEPVQAAYYPSSSKNKKDWSKIDKEIEEDIKQNKDEYGEGDPLNGLFKQIYQGADENTRRAMIKSFQTSGGTVLSTNWDEVKDKDYEGKDRPSPPKGQKYGDWNQK
ncbi:HSP20-like chaperone [Pseudocohnilembus persalinus]|uniref:HSP20-like chaperone n=1 Tax=Pseudocohnilembus persalinus TaxID=266149 RepID=A0A0V0QWJ4_PSEPJ|nr:HSP20-like chaperone [Pseudocohnilembus persalinus]|eukprot:KRX06771.1 HSP20-like chaperone [Pseudocohnilembus persalinus]